MIIFVAVFVFWHNLCPDGYYYFRDPFVFWPYLCLDGNSYFWDTYMMALFASRLIVLICLYFGLTYVLTDMIDFSYFIYFCLMYVPTDIVIV